MTKFPQKVRGRGPGAKYLNFKTSVKFVVGEARNFKFGVRIDLGKSHLIHK